MESTTKRLANILRSTPPENLQHELIRRLVSRNPDADIKAEDDFLSEQKLCGDKVDGNKCIKLLDACINGKNTHCQIAWSQLDWGAGIDWENMDYGAATKLAEKMGLNEKPVDKVIEELSKGAANNTTASSSLRMALEAIKNRISPSPQIKPVVPNTQLNGVRPRISVVFRNKYNNMIGGGSQKCNYANFVRCIDVVKTNISMKGGSDHAIFLRSGLSQLQKSLNDIGKEIQKDDLVRIKDLIDNLERIERRAQDLGIHMTNLNSALNQHSIVIPEPNKEITLKYIEELSNEANKLMSQSTSKATNLVEIFEQLDNIAKRLEKISS